MNRNELTMLGKKDKKIVFLLVWEILLCFGVHAQIKCVEPTLSNDEQKHFVQLYENHLKNQSKARTTANNYKVALRFNVILGTSDSQSTFSASDVNELIDHANVYFNKINVQFYLLDGRPNYIYDNENVNLKLENEQQFRTNYDVTNAINLYFFKTIVQKDLTLLNGFATLPNYSAASNRILFSYLDRNIEDFKTLKEKVFLHELGHYFGLFHTFQDSNHPDITKRELVTRGAGANCSTTGDQLCDTNSDPFERLPSISAYDCSASISPSVVDANREAYQPPVNNLMSYHVRCGNVFSNQQYQKMEASFGIRFSPAAQYQIVEKATNFITFTGFNKNIFCEGEQVEINFKTEGFFDNENKFTVMLSDASGTNFRAINATIKNNQAIIQLPLGLPASSNYRVRIHSSKPVIQSPIINNFELYTKGKIQLASTKSYIRKNESVDIKLSMDGSGPWNIKLSNGLELKNFKPSSTQFSNSLNETTTFSVQSAEGICGAISAENSLTVTVIQPSIEVLSSFNPTLCENDYVRIPVIGLKNFSSKNPYKIILVDDQQNKITLLPQVNIYSLLALLPSNLTIDRSYHISVEGESIEEYSIPTVVKVRKRPEKPSVTSPLEYCFNANVKQLSAQGNALKWYYGQNELTSYPQILPKTSQEGQYIYYVSQTDAFGCESSRNIIQVKIKQPVTADISGNDIIKLGEYAKLKVKMTGEAPWNVELSSGEKFSSENPINEQLVQPNKTSTYTLKKVQNQCGEGFVSGEAKVTVLSPLANEEFTKESNFTAFPSPFSDFLEIKSGSNQLFEKASLSISTLDGREIYRSFHQTILPNSQLTINGNSFPEGILLVTIEDEKAKFSTKVIKAK